MRLAGQRRLLGGDMDVVEVAPDMGPACSLGDVSIGIEPVESMITIGLQNAAEGCQVRAWMKRTAIRAVAVAHRRRPRAAIRPLATQVGPQPSGPGFANARSQHR